MLSCAAPAGMSAWPCYDPAPAIKAEPAEERAGGCYSDGFHSASPASSGKDSPGSVGSAGEPLPFYEGAALAAPAPYRPPFALLTPPAGEPPRFGYSPPARASTPLARGAATPPASPRSPDRFADSGFDGARDDADDADAGDGSGADDFDEEPGLRVPAVNSHGKVKTFKCKQCEFVAVTKLSFWEHSREHIKPEKMLACRKCPFVTEYKHHLEYHMRNHLGSKPFRCSQCSYSCVNKSMLNSHLKSHSNVYQYRCADCNYATKYCHSLKLHLRKYKHNPAMVLNSDGTPNPLPIIDVYGTRRGPKQKPAPPDAPEARAPAHPLFGARFPVALPYLPPLPSLPPLLPPSFLFPPPDGYEAPRAAERPPSPRSILQRRLAYGEAPPEPAASPPRAASPPAPRPPSPARAALDLTNARGGDAASPPPAAATPATPTTPTTPATATTAAKSRRKGRAFKLRPAALRLQHDDEVAGGSDSESDSAASAAGATSYSCQYCDIRFGDLTMHTIHMGFHGYNDPFMCNKCGERSADRIAFFVHLGRAQHA